MHLNRTLVKRPSIVRNLAPLALVFALALQVTPLFAASAPVPGVVNINTAGAAELTLLPRVGPSLAERILAFRKDNGEWKKAEDLILVRGIGEKTFRVLEPFVVTEGKTTLTRKVRKADVEQIQAASDAKSPQNQGSGSDPRN